MSSCYSVLLNIGLMSPTFTVCGYFNEKNLKWHVFSGIFKYLFYIPGTHYAEQSEGPYGELSPLMNEWMGWWNAAHSFCSEILPPILTKNSPTSPKNVCNRAAESNWLITQCCQHILETIGGTWLQQGRMAKQPPSLMMVCAALFCMAASYTKSV